MDVEFVVADRDAVFVVVGRDEEAVWDEVEEREWAVAEAEAVVGRVFELVVEVLLE